MVASPSAKPSLAFSSSLLVALCSRGLSMRHWGIVPLPTHDWSGRMLIKMDVDFSNV